MNVAITKAANKVAISLGLVKENSENNIPMATIHKDKFSPKTWQSLVGDGSIRKLYLSRETVDNAFKGTAAEHIDEAAPEQKQDMFTEIYFAEADVPTIGKNLLGDSEYEYLINSLKENEHAIVVMGNGYSFKGSGYVRGGIFDRLQVIQNDKTITFRDLDQNRILDLYADGTPSFKEKSVFIIRAENEFNPGVDWQLELLVKRQTGAVDSLFNSFKANYHMLDDYVTRPAVVPPEPELTLTQQIWQERKVQVIILISLMVVLLITLFFQDILVQHPTFLHNFRHLYLLITVVFIGWSWGGQLSVVNVFTFLQAFMNKFSWDLFLLDPAIFILWCAAAVTVLLWGRAVYCGWLCPFGALQELLNVVARYIKLPQIELPWAVHERLWAIKYLILLGLFGLSLDSLAAAEKFAEIEPFKTTFLLKFDREWPFILYAVSLLVINLFSRKVFLLKFDRELPFIAWALFLLTVNLFNRKFFCRYLCPLGAALSVSNSARLFSWLKRRPECGQPCKTCAKECEIQAIHPDGTINMRECHYCLDCQITYFNDEKCPPLKKLARKKNRFNENPIPTLVQD